jgi:hypothetical protein
MALNGLGSEKRTPPPAPVTLPKFEFTDDTIEAEAREAAARVAEKKVIRHGRECWEAIGRAESFENWKAIAAALVIGRDFALRSSGANSTNGRIYTWALKGWLDQNFGLRPMPKQTRYWCLQLNDNLLAIEQWRTSLSERQRRRLVTPVAVVRHWQRATGQLKSRCVDDVQKAAAVAWRRFITCVEALPADRAAPFWQIAHDQAAARIAP